MPFADHRPFLAVPLGASRGQRGQVAWHAAEISECVDQVEGLPVTDAGRTWLDLGQHLQLPDLVAVTDRILRMHVRLAGLPRPVVSMDVIHDGDWIGCGDLVWPGFRLYVEYDGEHHDDPRQRHQDALTRNRLDQLGWTVRVVTKEMMRKVDEVVSMLAADLYANGWSG